MAHRTDEPGLRVWNVYLDGDGKTFCPSHANFINADLAAADFAPAYSCELRKAGVLYRVVFRPSKQIRK